MFNDASLKEFECFKENLILAPIIVSPNWSIPFKVICTADRMALAAGLVQRHKRIIHPIYYASKKLNATQNYYIMLEQELCTMVFYI